MGHELRRRDFLTMTGLGFASFMVGSLTGNAQPENGRLKSEHGGSEGFFECLPEAERNPMPVDAFTAVQWPFPFSALDVAATAQAGYDGFYQGACSYGAFNALVSQWAAAQGEPFSSIPTRMMQYGEGGVAGWGTLCGTINGASAAIGLVCQWNDAKVLVNELVAWYADTALPIFIPAGKDPIITNAAGSPLCHVSVTKWCELANAGATSAARKERCARLVADVAGKTASMLNEFYAGTFVPIHDVSNTTKSCMNCHGDKWLNDTLGKMECRSCHSTVHLQATESDGWIVR